MSKLIVGILFGGRSVEHEISLLSAKSILINIDKKKFDIFPILIDKEGIWKKAIVGEWLKDGELNIEQKSILYPSLNPSNPEILEIKSDKVIKKHRIDVVFPILHGTFGEDGAVQGLLELMGIPYIGTSVLGSSLGMDKIIMKMVFKQYGLPVVNFTGFYSYEWEKKEKDLIGIIHNHIGMPCFVKSADLGSSVGITKVNTIDDLSSSIEYSCNFSNRIIIEQAVQDPREIEISVLGNYNPVASLPGEIIPDREFYDYKAKYIEDGTELIAPAKLPQHMITKLQGYAIKAFTSIDCAGMGRVDFLINKDTNQIYISELNTIPGFTQISMYPRLWEVSGLNYQDLITRLIDLAIEKYNIKKNIKTEI